ncbi:hypothetical protein VcTj87_21980 [Vibrio comitans]
MIISDTDYTNISYKAIIDTFNSKNWGIYTKIISEIDNMVLKYVAHRISYLES